jgi:hypothetical protein
MGMASANNMDLCYRLMQTLSNLVGNLINCQRESSFLSQPPAKGAKPAAIYADVAIVDMLVINPIGVLTMESLPYQVGQESYGKEILRLKESETVFP